MAGKYRVAVIGDSDRGGYGHGIDNCCLEIPATQIVAVADTVESGRADRVQTLKNGKQACEDRHVWW